MHPGQRLRSAVLEIRSNTVLRTTAGTDSKELGPQSTPHKLYAKATPQHKPSQGYATADGSIIVGPLALAGTPTASKLHLLLSPNLLELRRQHYGQNHPVFQTEGHADPNTNPHEACQDKRRHSHQVHREVLSKQRQSQQGALPAAATQEALQRCQVQDKKETTEGPWQKGSSGLLEPYQGSARDFARRAPGQQDHRKTG